MGTGVHSVAGRATLRPGGGGCLLHLAKVEARVGGCWGTLKARMLHCRSYHGRILDLDAFFVWVGAAPAGGQRGLCHSDTSPAAPESIQHSGEDGGKAERSLGLSSLWAQMVWIRCLWATPLFPAKIRSTVEGH